MANILTRWIDKHIEKRAQIFGHALVAGFPGLQFLGGVGLSNHANVQVNAETANKLSAFYSCVRNVSEDIGKLPCFVLQSDSRGNKIPQPSHPATQLLNERPNLFAIPATLKQNLIDSALRKGDGFAFIERDQFDNTPTALYFLEHETVLPILNEDRRIYYKITDPILKINGTFTSDNVFHLRGMGNGFRGVSVLQYAAESLGTGIATQNYAGGFYAGGGTMKGLLKVAGAKDETHAKTIKKAFMDSVAEDGVGAMNSQTEFTKMSYTADEAQMLESREFTVKDIARWFRMPLSKLQTSDQVKNIEQLEIQYVNDCLEPWITRIEQEVKLKLIEKNDRAIYSFHIDTWPLLTGDSTAQEKRIKTWFMIGGQTQNQLLRSLNMNGIGKAGDETFVPVNMIPRSLVNQFWENKGANNIPENSPDSSGSGASNGNINEGRSFDETVAFVNKLMQLAVLENNN